MSQRDNKELDKARVLRPEEISTTKEDCKKQIGKIRAAFASLRHYESHANVTNVYNTIKEATPSLLALQKIAQAEGTAATQDVFSDVFNDSTFTNLMEQISFTSNKVCDLRDDEDDTLWNFCHTSIQSINRNEGTSKRLVKLLTALKPQATISFPAENQDTPSAAPTIPPQVTAAESKPSTSEADHKNTAASEQPSKVDHTTVPRGRGLTAIWNNVLGRKSSTVNSKANDTPSHKIPVSSSSMNLSAAHPKPAKGADETKETRSSVSNASHSTFVGSGSFSNLSKGSKPIPTPANNTNTGVDVYIFDETGEANKTPDEQLTMIQ